MGQYTSKYQQITLMQKYTQIQKQQHIFLGTITHLIHQSLHTKHFLKIFKFTTENQLNLAVKKINKRKQLSLKKGSNNIIRATQAESNKNNQLCGITYYLYAIYQDYNTSLSTLIQQHQSAQQHFSQQQILQMLRNICQGLLFLQDNGYKNYTITKQSIVKQIKQSNKAYLYKILDLQLSKQILPYTKLLNSIPIQKGTYLSPQILQQLHNRNTDPDLSLKSDIYSLAMVALQMCLLQPLDLMYNYDKYQINQYQILQKLNSLKSYSSYLKSILSQMLQFNQQQRIGAVSLRQKLHLGNLCNDGKSTTDYGYSAIQNSNITQKTYKTSYPTANLNPKQLIQNNENIQQKPTINLNMQRVLTLKQMKNSQKKQLSSQNLDKKHYYKQTIQPHNNPHLPHKNKTIEYKSNKIIHVGSTKNKYNKPQSIKNKSTLDTNHINNNINNNSKTNNPSHHPFLVVNNITSYFQPNITKPMTVPLISNNLNHTFLNTFNHHLNQIHNKSENHLQQLQVDPIINNHVNGVNNNLNNKINDSIDNTNNDDKLNIPRLPPQTLPPTLSFNSIPLQQFPSSHLQPINTNSPNKAQHQIKKVPQLILPDQILQQKLSPQTPINNLKDSMTILSQQKLGQYIIKNSKSFSDDHHSIEVLTSINNTNPNYKHPQPNNQQNSSIFLPQNIQIINQTNIEYQSPQKYQKQLIPSSIFDSNQSTPIRKVQALQSYDKISHKLPSQIINQTSEQYSKQINLSSLYDDKIPQKNPFSNSQNHHHHHSKIYDKYQFTNGRIYQGQIDSIGNFCGSGILYFSNGNVCYNGGWNQGFFHGFGILNNQISANCYIPTNYQNFEMNPQSSWHHYEGQFSMGKKCGVGTLYMANGDKFSGSFINDAIEGYGTFVDTKGQKIQGIWNNNILKKF